MCAKVLKNERNAKKKEHDFFFMLLFLNNVLLESDVQTEVETDITVEGNARSTSLANHVVHAHEYVHALGVNIEYPTHGSAE